VSGPANLFSQRHEFDKAQALEPDIERNCTPITGNPGFWEALSLGMKVQISLAKQTIHQNENGGTQSASDQPIMAVNVD